MFAIVFIRIRFISKYDVVKYIQKGVNPRQLNSINLLEKL